jgi:hypothetical protein
VRAFLKAVLAEIERDPALAGRIAERVDASRKRPKGRRANRRSPPVLDPFALWADVPNEVGARLAELTVDQLKDIVSEYGIEPRTLALKWKRPERLIELILTTVEQRSRKGDAFRTAPPTGQPPAAGFSPSRSIDTG